MTTHTITCYIFMTRTFDFSKPGCKEVWKPALYSFKPDNSTSSVFVAEQLVTVEVPDNWTPVLDQLAALDKQDEEASKDYLRKLNERNEQRQRLLALTLSPSSGECDSEPTNFADLGTFAENNPKE